LVSVARSFGVDFVGVVVEKV